MILIIIIVQRRFNRRRFSSGRADEGPWQHDKFGSEGNNNERRNNTNTGGRPRGEGRVKITNLHYTVMEQDLQVSHPRKKNFLQVVRLTRKKIYSA